MKKIQRALISVADKNGIVPLAQTLRLMECEIISTGGTRKVLEEAGIEVTDISAITQNPEAFSGRLKTLSFPLAGSLLFQRGKDDEEAKKLGIGPIDLVVCNLYPFEKAHANEADLEELIENIDIGGPTMIRAAAKNFKDVAVVVDPSDYPGVESELKNTGGFVSYDIRKTLMLKAFSTTADYDSFIAAALLKESGQETVRLAFEQGKELRYGENSHQKAKIYRLRGAKNSLLDMKVLHGKELSYNNLLDINAAQEAISPLKRQACAVIKHNTPCGLAEASSLRTSIERAWAADTVSAFGSVVAFNQTVDKETASFFGLSGKNKKFVEVIVQT